ncbi:hypothetical protein M0R45_003446 [Rubus argutus]|uniref:6-phosphogluconate dehydrogenase NADP-binding domain-containing protein n=1 Tax=Rubus argutus TaxID=59490 RepID=A0AAW1YGZ3_RUBAR
MILKIVKHFPLPLVPRVSSHLTTLSLLRRRTMAASAEPTVSPSTTRVGWIGTGVMGRPSSTWAPTSPIPLAPSPPQSDVVFSIVGYPSDVRSVLLDPNTGALSGLRPGGVLVDMTTSDPSLAVEISESAAAKNCSSIDAPVTGGDVGAKNGTLAILAGGEETVVRKLTPLFGLMGKVNYMGGSGKGQFAKLGNQTIIASNYCGVSRRHDVCSQGGSGMWGCF